MQNPYREATPFATPDGPTSSTAAEIHERATLVDHYAWAIPTTDAVDFITQHGPMLEIGAGRGYWAWCIDQRGGDIIATDIDPPRDPWYPVERLDARDAVDTYRERTVILCCPETDQRWPTDALDHIDNELVALVGPRPHPTTELHHRLESEWLCIGSRRIPTFFGQPHHVRIYRNTTWNTDQTFDC